MILSGEPLHSPWMDILYIQHCLEVIRLVLLITLTAKESKNRSKMK